MNEALKRKLAQAYHVLHMEGLAEDTIRGHITARSNDNRIYIKPWALGFEEVTAKNLLGVDLEGILLKEKADSMLSWPSTWGFIKEEMMFFRWSMFTRFIPSSSRRCLTGDSRSSDRMECILEEGFPFMNLRT